MDERNNKPERRRGRIRKIIKGVADFLRQREKIIIEKEEIMSILPHRGRVLLLDQVVITQEKIVGELLVTKEAYEEHRVWEDKIVMVGSDFLDMSAQLLGVWAAQHFSFKSKAKTVVKSYGGVEFYGPVFPGDLLILEVNTENVSAIPRAQGRLVEAEGEKFLAKVGENKIADIVSVKLVLLGGKA